jgi:hypothetical protein
MAPFLEAMRQEGSAVMRPPCNTDDEIVTPTPKCTKGSPWVEERALNVMVGDFLDPSVTLVNNDNFHPAAETIHYHHPEISNSCADTTGACTVQHVSINTNEYDRLNELDLGKTPIAATEMKAKFKSIQQLRLDAR